VNRVLLRRLLLAAMLCTFGVLKLYYEPGHGSRADGFYYTQIAQNLLDGEGYTSRVSLYMQGFAYFPHPVNQPPGWIVLLAGSAGLFGMDFATRHVPEALYLLDLLLLYLLANRLRRRVSDGGPGWLRADGLPDFGHVAVFLLGANAVFFRFTSLPYTEALGFAFLFGSLLSLDRAAVERSLGWAAAAGVLTALALLTRFQFLPAIIALPGALVLVSLRDRRYLGLAGAFAVAFALSWIPWAAWLSSWLDPLTPTGVLGLATLQETDHLRPFEHAVVTDSLGAYLLDRASGLLVAFHPAHEYSYTSQWGPLVWLVLITPVWVVVRGLPGLRVLIRGPAPERVLPWAMLACAVGMLIPVHMLHGVFFKEWFFGHRHGLPLLLAILPCMAWLDASGRASRIAGVTLLAGSVAFMSYRLGGAMTRPFDGYPQSEFQVGEWLDARDGHPTVITTRPQRMSARSRRAYFHWMACREPPEQMLGMLRKKMAKYVIIFEYQKGCRFSRFEVRRRYLKKLRTFGVGEDAIRLYKLRNLGPPTPGGR
jgi:4-amino-4-deoxy-L-arabinose transferase-like glycosyltransferase